MHKYNFNDFLSRYVDDVHEVSLLDILVQLPGIGEYSKAHDEADDIFSLLDKLRRKICRLRSCFSCGESFLKFLVLG